MLKKKNESTTRIFYKNGPNWHEAYSLDNGLSVLTRKRVLL